MLVPFTFIAILQPRSDFGPCRLEKRILLNKWVLLLQIQRLLTRQQASREFLSSASSSIIVSKVSCGILSMWRCSITDVARRCMGDGRSCAAGRTSLIERTHKSMYQTTLRRRNQFPTSPQGMYTSCNPNSVIARKGTKGELKAVVCPGETGDIVDPGHTTKRQSQTDPEGEQRFSRVTV